MIAISTSRKRMCLPFSFCIALVFLVIAGCGGGGGGGDTQPPAPTETCATPSSIVVPATNTTGAYTITWGSSSTASVAYILEEATNNGFSSGLRTAYSGASTSTSITGQATGVTYFYRVKAARSGYADSAWQTGVNGCVVTIDQTPAPVPQTGQTTSYAANDDGDLQPGVSYPAPRFTDNSNGTVTDNATGLIWLKNANAFGTKNWIQALDACAALASGQTGLTDGSTAGQWRLPNHKELMSLVDFGRFNPALPAGHPFSSVQSGSYWSSTSYAGVTGYAWFVSFGYGYVSIFNKTYTYYVWPVRGGPAADIPVPRTGAGDLPGYTEDPREDGTTQRGVAWPVPRFTDQGNGTVRDNLTRLIWLKNANALWDRTWAQALTDCATLASGKADLTDNSTAGQWRLPSIRELESLVCARYAYAPTLSDAQGTGPWTAGNPFSSVQSAVYWSSTSYASDTGVAWFVSFSHGYVDNGGKTSTFYVWPVRGGPVPLEPSAIGMLEGDPGRNIPPAHPETIPIPQSSSDAIATAPKG